MNNLYTKVNDLDIVNLKTVPVNLKKLSDVVDNEVVKNSKFNTQNTKVNGLEKKISNPTSIVYINQYNTNK